MFLRIQDFQLEYDGECANDYDTLSIYDDNYANPLRLIGVFCGEVYPETVTSSGENMFVVFKSDGSIQARGFQVAYYFLPGKRGHILHRKITMAGDSVPYALLLQSYLNTSNSAAPLK